MIFQTYRERLVKMAEKRYPIINKSCASERQTMTVLRHNWVAKQLSKLTNAPPVLMSHERVQQP